MVADLSLLKLVLDKAEEPAATMFFSCLFVLWIKLQYPCYTSYLVSSKLSFIVFLVLLIFPTSKAVGQVIGGNIEFMAFIVAIATWQLIPIPPNLSTWFIIILLTSGLASSLNSTTRLLYLSIIIILYLLSRGGAAPYYAIALTGFNLLMEKYLLHKQYKNFMKGILYIWSIIAIVLASITPN